MSSIHIQDTDPIPLVAAVTTTAAGYVVTLEYNVPPVESVDDITDDFGTMPSSVTVNVTSTTVPSGYYLEASGGGTWTSSGASSISGVFTIRDPLLGLFDFSVRVTNGSLTLAKADPRLIVRKMNSDD
jgi:hypothetical protein